MHEYIYTHIQEFQCLNFNIRKHIRKNILFFSLSKTHILNATDFLFPVQNPFFYACVPSKLSQTVYSISNGFLFHPYGLLSIIGSHSSQAQTQLEPYVFVGSHKHHSIISHVNTSHHNYTFAESNNIIIHIFTN